MRSCQLQYVHFTVPLARWDAHYWLFSIGAYISGTNINVDIVGCHARVIGSTEIQLRVGTYVHVEGRIVSSQGSPVGTADDTPLLMKVT